jgi:hypothetical protein
MPFAGFELNPKHTEPWVAAIGKFMVNFGGVESATLLWIDHLSDDLILKELAIEMPLARRIELIRKLLERRNLPKKLLNESKSAWGKAEKLSRIRNEIAHNPVIFGWHGEEAQRPPDFIGSLNFRRLKPGAPRVSPLLEFTALNRSVDEVAHLAGKLHSILQDVLAAPSEA